MLQYLPGAITALNQFYDTKTANFLYYTPSFGPQKPIYESNLEEYQW